MALWADLPEELLDEILKQVTCHSDIVQFGIVCKSWSAVAHHGYNCLPTQLPLSCCFPQPKLSPVLMFPSKDGSVYCNFWSPTDCKVTGDLSLPETRGKWPCASSLGWAVMVDFKVPEELVLFNPITRAQIQLPPLSTFPVHQNEIDPDDPREFFFIHRAALSADPAKDPDNWILVVVVSHRKKLCFYRAGEDKWKSMKRGEYWPVYDVMYSQGRFYAVNNQGCVSTFNFAFDTPKFEILTSKGVEQCSTYKYLVLTSQGDLIQVSRTLEDDEDTAQHDEDTACDEDTAQHDVPKRYYTDMVIVHKLLDASKNSWEELESLGDDVLFLGPSAALCFSRNELPQLKANSLYLTDERWRFVEDDNVQCLDSGIFDYEDGSVQPFDSVDPSHLMRSLWIVPSIL